MKSVDKDTELNEDELFFDGLKDDPSSNASFSKRKASPEEFEKDCSKSRKSVESALFPFR